MEEKMIKDFFERDQFAKLSGIYIEDFSPGKSTCSLQIENHHLNAGASVQGGVIFTLADFAFAVAAYANGRKAVSLENQITFMHSACGRKLTAEAYEISAAQKLCFYQVDVTNEYHKPIARMSVTGYIII